MAAGLELRRCGVARVGELLAEVDAEAVCDAALGLTGLEIELLMERFPVVR